MTRKLLALALVLLAAPAAALHLGDFAPGSTVDFKFNTRTATGAPITFAGTPSLTVYKANGDVQDGGDITLTVDFDSITGMHHVRIDTSIDPTFYASGGEYQVTVVQGTVNAQSVAGQVVASFSLNNRSALRPTTAGRTLTIEADGMAHADVKEVGGTTQTAGDIIGDTNDIQNRLPATLSGGRMRSQVEGMDSDTVTAAAVANDAVDSGAVATSAVTEIQSGLSTHSAADVWAAGTRTLTSFGTLAADVWSNGTRTLTSFGSLSTDVTAIKGVTDKLDTALELDGLVYRYTTNALEQAPTGGAAPTAATIADAVWDELLAGHATSGSAGEYLARADVATSSRAASGVVVTTTSPIGQAGVLSMKVSDDYKIADGTAITFSYTGSAVITGGTAVMKTYDAGNTAIGATLTGTISGSAGAYTVSIEATAVQTALLSSYAGAINLRYDVEATVSGRKTTILSGLLKVLQD